MALPIRQGATHKVTLGPAVAVGDGFTPVTTLAVSSADDAEAILHDNGTVVDISGYTFAAITTADGYYHLTLQSGISNTVGHLKIIINDDSLILPLREDFVVIDTAAYDAMYKDGAEGPLQATTVGRKLDVTATGAAGIDWGNVENKTTANDLSGTDIQLVATTTTNTDMVAAAPTAAANADAVWDEDATGHQTGGTFGQAIGDPGANTETMYDAVITDAAGTNIAADIIVIDGNVDDIETAVGALNDISTADVNAEVVDVMTVDVVAEAAQGAPPNTDSIADMTQRLYSALINLVDIDATEKIFHNAAGTATWKKALADDGTNYTEAKGASGA